MLDNLTKARRWATCPDPGTPPALTREETHDHAAELLRALTEHAGDPPAVNATMLRWLDAHDVHQHGRARPRLRRVHAPPTPS